MKRFSIPIILLFISFTFAAAPNIQERVRKQIELGIKAAVASHWDEALYRWKKATELDPKNAAAHNNLAVALEQFGYFDLAVKEYEIAFKLAPGNQAIKTNIGSFKESYKIK